MNKQEIKEQVLKILDENKVGTLATVQNDKPYSRYMTFFHEGTTLYSASSKETHKVEELRKNPHVHILLGYDGEGLGHSYLEIEGTATLNDSEDIKKKVWNGYLKPWFDGPEDPNYIVLEIKPSQVHLMNVQNKEPQTLEL
jgi:general stress protein 26